MIALSLQLIAYSSKQVSSKLKASKLKAQSSKLKANKLKANKLKAESSKQKGFQSFRLAAIGYELLVGNNKKRGFVSNG